MTYNTFNSGLSRLLSIDKVAPENPNAKSHEYASGRMVELLRTRHIQTKQIRLHTILYGASRPIPLARYISNIPAKT